MLGSVFESMLRVNKRAYLAVGVPSSAIWSVLVSIVEGVLENILVGVPGNIHGV
jgi:hypothetical protein